MGTCKYCGKDAGWFSKVHKECEDKHQQGLNDFSAVLSNYFTQRVSSSEVQKEKRRLASDTFLPIRLSVNILQVFIVLSRQSPCT